MQVGERPGLRRRWIAQMDMNAIAIVERIVSLPTGRSVPASSPLTAISQIAGIEVAITGITRESAFRKAWRDRKGGGATPLLLIADDPTRAGSLFVLGVVDANGPLRSVESAALAEVLERISPKPRLEAIRELSAELERLDQAGIPGLKLRDLLTMHTLDVRLRTDQDRWKVLVGATNGIDRGADWRTVLTSLGYDVEKLKNRGHLARYEGRPVAVVHPYADPSDFSRLNAESRPPEGILINDCLNAGADFGILSSGSRLRLFQVKPSSGNAVARYIDLDASALQVGDFPFLGLLSPGFLVDDGFDELANDARAFGSALRKRVDHTIRQSVLPALGKALGRWATAQGRDLTVDAVREDLEHAALTFLFRSLFLLYAESGGHLPMDNRSYGHASLTSLVKEASETQMELSSNSKSLWDRYKLLVKVMRDGNPAWGVPAYNGALFARDGFLGAETLEALELPDPDFAVVLMGIGRDEETEAGVDYSTLEIGHLGHIYEGLLSLRLSLATGPLRYDLARDSYVAIDKGDDAEFEAGDLLWQTHEGGRKAGGVYYTRSELVNHLVKRAVVPAFEKHLNKVRALAETDPKGAASLLFDFTVLDPACGSAHFLVNVVAELSDLVVRFLGDVPLPEINSMLGRLRTGASAGAAIDDVALIRRLVMKRCVYGVDLSPMGAEIAKISLWLVSFVPGLSLAYLDRNILVGNSLVGVALPQGLRPPGTKDQIWFLEDALREGIQLAAEAVARVAESEDRNPDEIGASKVADAEARDATRRLATLFDLWTAGAFGLKEARQEVELHGPAILEGRENKVTSAATEISNRHRFLHWPLAFPAVFSGDRNGFDAVIGNPPWEEITIEELAFYARFAPGIRALLDKQRSDAIQHLLSERPDLVARYKKTVHQVREHRDYYPASGEYPSLPGDPDLYKYFCQRYALLLRTGGNLGVVLPRSAFGALGSEGFRRWLFEQNACQRIDFLLNNRLWMFDTHPQWTVALVVAERASPHDGHKVAVAGTATSLEDWVVQSASEGIQLDASAFGPGWTVPLLRSQAEAELLSKLRCGSSFPLGSAGRWRCFPVRELDETNDKKLWDGPSEGWPLWKGESFEQYDPHGAESRWCPPNAATMKKVTKPKPGLGSLLAAQIPLSERQRAVRDEIGKARVAFRDVSRATDSRTVRACLVPPEVFLTNKAPYLAFVDGGDVARAVCLGLMNSTPFDWQARRFVEINMNFFILEGLIVPDLSAEDFDAIAKASARLSCPDERFTEFADSLGVDYGPLDEDERMKLRVEIDAIVAKAWKLNQKDLELIFKDFTADAVSPEYRKALLERFKELT